jgi:hypothetical protein
MQAPKIVSAEKVVTVDGNYYLLTAEIKESWKVDYNYNKGASKGNIDLSFAKKTFAGKFIYNEIIIGNLSFMIKGVDGKGNYGYFLIDLEGGNITPIASGFDAKILKKLGVEVKCIFDENKKEWRISYQKNGKEVAYGVYTGEGERTGGQLDERFDALYEKTKADLEK